MVVIIVESAPPGLRGELTKWMIEPKAGVYVGSISGAVRDLLWDKVCKQIRYGGCVMVHSAANEQGFVMRSYGDTTRVVEQWEGLYLVRRLPRADDRVMERAPYVMRLWAKADPFQPLPCHLVDVGHVALSLLETTAFRNILPRFVEATQCPEDIILSWIGYLVALHDWGKGWRNFQGRDVEGVHPSLFKTDLNLTVEEVERGIRHEVISRRWLEEHLEKHWNWHKRSFITVGAAIGAHHGRIGQKPSSLQKFTGIEKWEQLKIEIEEMVRAAFSPSPWTADFADHSVAGMLLSGLIVWSDWIASNAQLFPLRWQGEAWEDYVASSKIAAQRAVEKLGLGKENVWREPKSFPDLWPGFDQPRAIQTAAIELIESGLDSGLVIIEAPMGEGKTEAALYLATQWMQEGGGMYIGLPTAATSNQMHTRVQDLIAEHDPTAKGSVQLVHGAAWLIDKFSPDTPPELSDDDQDPNGHLAYEWFVPRKRSLLATYGVGTIDQALMSVLHVKHGFLRLFGLAGKVLLIDEVHAYDAYMTEILTLLLTWCRALDIRVILLSATLPGERRAELVAAYSGGKDSAHRKLAKGNLAPYPLITAVSTAGEVCEIEVPPGDRTKHINLVKHEGLLGNPEAISELAIKTLADEGCVCVIANTVGSAQAIYDNIRKRRPDIPTLLFHSRFLSGDRQKIENRALQWFDKRSLLPLTDPKRMERPKKAILVATQVVEQSLDLDFDAMITEVAPIDLMLQRSGRLHRHDRSDRPEHHFPAELHVVLPSDDSADFASTARVYEPYVLLRTRRALKESWTLPDDMRTLIESVYDFESQEKPFDNELEKAYDKMKQSESESREQAGKYLIPEPYPRAFKLDRAARALFEDDEGLNSYFSAKTRQGNQTMTVLVVNNEQWAELSEYRSSPGKKKLQRLLRQSVSLPRWWLKDVEPNEGYHDLERSPRWLTAERIIVAEDNEWCGIKPDGSPIKIVINEEVGVQLLVEGACSVDPI